MAERRHAYQTTTDFMHTSLEPYALKCAYRTLQKKCMIKILSDVKLAILTGDSLSVKGPITGTLATSPPITSLDDLIAFDETYYLTQACNSFNMPNPEPTVINRIEALMEMPQLGTTLKWAAWRIVFLAKKRIELSNQAADLLQQSWVDVFALLDHPRESVLIYLTYVLIKATLYVVGALCPQDTFMDRTNGTPYQAFIVFVFQQMYKDLTGIIIHQSTVKNILMTYFDYAWENDGGELDWPSPFSRCPAYTTTQFSPMVSKLQGDSHLRTKMDAGRKVKSIPLILPVLKPKLQGHRRRNNSTEQAPAARADTPGSTTLPPPVPKRRATFEFGPFWSPWDEDQTDFCTSLRKTGYFSRVPPDTKGIA
eukprot:GEMP01048199.1.p1 GENE.GEMP01048199.1~~GEMP01048199.1.p1  ORF type:complete len:367 (+),score=67.98 GEMP01048199.1:206-1306(+)